MEKIKQIWRALQSHAHQHHAAYHKTHNGMHLCYLGLVAFHGPYNLAAGGLFVILVIGWVLHLEE